MLDNTLQITALLEGNTFHAECAALTAAPVANRKAIVTCYLVIPGFEIEQTY